MTKEQDAYWEGFFIGSTPPGLGELFGVEIRDRVRRTDSAFGEGMYEVDYESSEDQAYWMGVAGGTAVITGILSGGMYLATAGESMSFFTGVSIVMFEFGKVVTPYVLPFLIPLVVSA